MRKIPYGVIGIKGIGQYHLQHALQHPMLEVVALVDIDDEYVHKKAAELNIKGFTNYRSFLAANMVEAVSIATPHFLLAPIGLACLKAGIHIFVEKPFVTRISEADELLRVAKAKRLKIGVAFQYRTYQTPKKLKHLLSNNKIGRLQRVLWTWFEFRSQAYYNRAEWRATWEGAGGGLLTNQISHDLDLMQWLFGFPKSVSAFLGNQLHQTKLEDIACINFEFDKGAFGTLQASINQPKAFNIRQIVGQKGMIVIPNAQGLTKNVADNIHLGLFDENLMMANTSLRDHHEQPSIAWRKIARTTLKGKIKNHLKQLLVKYNPKNIKRIKQLLQKKKNEIPQHGHGFLIDDFVTAIVEDKEPFINGESAAKTVELINAIILSAISQKTVSLPINRKEFDDLYKDLCIGEKEIANLPQKKY